jgi:hypothetical protein
MAGNSRTITIKFDGTAKGLISSATAASKAIRRIGDDTSGLTKAQNAADDLSAKLDQTAKDAKEKGSLMGGLFAVGLSAAAPLASAALVGGVALGFVGAAALIQKNNAQVKQSFGNLKDQVVSEMQSASNQVVPYLVKAGNSLQQEFANLGPQLKTAFSFAGPDLQVLTKGVNSFADNAMPGFVGALKNSKPIVVGISNILGNLGTTVTTVLNSVSSHSKEFGVDLDQIGSLIQNVGAIGAGVLPGLANGFGTSIGTVNELLTVLKPIAPAVGDITGEVLPAVGAFKLFGLATSPLNKLGSKVAGVASNLGGYTKSLTGSDKAGARVTTTTAKLGSAFGKLGNALPFVGAGFAAASAGAELFFGSTDQLANSLLTQTGSALQGTEDKLRTNDAAALGLRKSLGSFGGFLASTFIPTTKSVESGLSSVQKAQIGYTEAVQGFGPKSSQAVAAQKTLSAAVAAGVTQQDNLNRATLTSNQLLSQHVTDLLTSASADLSLQGAVNSVADAQTAYSDAVKKSGKNSLAAKEASVALQQALVTQVQAAGEAAAANDKNGTAAQKDKDRTAGQTAAVLGLVEGYAKSGKTVPAALANIAIGLSKTQFQAAITTGQVEGVSRSLSKLPPGKSTKVSALTSQAIADLRAVGDKVTHLPNGKFKITAQDGATATINNIITKNNGRRITLFVDTQDGAVRAAGTKISARAHGGPVLSGIPYIVGDGGGPEIFVPHQSGRIVGTSESADILGGGGTGGGGLGGWSGDLVVQADLGAGMREVLRISNRDLRARVKAGAGAR